MTRWGPAFVIMAAIIGSTTLGIFIMWADVKNKEARHQRLNEASPIVWHSGGNEIRRITIDSMVFFLYNEKQLIHVK